MKIGMIGLGRMGANMTQRLLKAGHQVVVWRDAQGTCCYTGDVMPTVHHAHLSASLGYDVLPYQTMLTKRALLELADRERWRLVLDHESGDCVVQRGMAG